MLIKEAIVVPADKSGIWLVRVIHTYSKLKKTLVLNAFGKCSVRSTNVRNIFQKKKKKRFLFIRTGFLSYKCGFSSHTHKSVLLLKKRLTPVGRRVLGFISKKVRRRRAISSFSGIL